MKKFLIDNIGFTACSNVLQDNIGIKLINDELVDKHNRGLLLFHITFESDGITIEVNNASKIEQKEFIEWENINQNILTKWFELMSSD